MDSDKPRQAESLDTTQLALEEAYTWIKTISGETSFGTAYDNFFKRKGKVNEVCYIEIKPSCSEDLIKNIQNCSKLEILGEGEKEKILEKIFDLLYNDELIKYHFDSEFCDIPESEKKYKIFFKRYGVLCYPKFLLDKKKIENVIIFVTESENTGFKIRFIVICLCRFNQFLKFLLYNESKMPPILSALLGPWEKHGLLKIRFKSCNYLNIMKQSEKISSFLGMEKYIYHDPKYYENINNKRFAEQITRLLHDIYHIKIYYTGQDIPRFPIMIENNLKNAKNPKSQEESNKKFVIEKISMENEKAIGVYQDKLNTFVVTPFYHYLSFFKNRNYLESLKLAYGEMTYGESFYLLFGKEDKRIEKIFELSRKSFDILSNQINLKWQFIPVICLSISLSFACFLLIHQLYNIAEFPKIVAFAFYSLFYIIFVLFLFTVGILLGTYIALILLNFIRYVRKKYHKNGLYLKILWFVRIQYPSRRKFIFLRELLKKIKASPP